MIKTGTLDTLSEASVIRTFLDAFSDYATSFSAQQVSSIFKIRGFDPKMSFGAFDDGRLVAFVFNGIGSYNNVPSAYDSGTGTLPEYRGRGLVKDLLKFGENHLKEYGIGQYVLEVLCGNLPAIHIYENDGFIISRELVCFSQKKSDISIPHMNEIDGGIGIETAGPEILQHIDKFIDYQPSWQNSVESMARGGDDVLFFAASVCGTPIGVAAINARQGDLMMLAVEKSYRGRGIGSRLLECAIGSSVPDTVKILNVDSRCSSMLALLKSCNISETVRQYEMIKYIDPCFSQELGSK